MPDNDQDDITRSHLQLAHGSIIGYCRVTKQIAADLSAVLIRLHGQAMWMTKNPRMSVLQFLVYIFIALSAFNSSKASQASEPSDSSFKDTT